MFFSLLASEAARGPAGGPPTLRQTTGAFPQTWTLPRELESACTLEAEIFL